MAITPKLDVVTGAFSYTGKYITDRLLARGRAVRTLTGHPDRPNPFGHAVTTAPYAFEDHATLVESLSGVDTFYNTYWVRFPYAGSDHDIAVKHSRALIDAAAEAGVRRMVHISITNPERFAEWRYYSGKAEIEQYLGESGLSHAIVRPTVIFGDEDILINNVAWLLRRLHVFAIPGDGRYRLRPVHVEDLAGLCVRLGGETENVTVNAVGPEVFTFEEMVRLIAERIGVRALILHLPPQAVIWLVKALNLLVGDLILTPDEFDGMRAELIMAEGEPTCPTLLSDWLEAHSSTVGTRYHSEVSRHYR